MSSRSSSRSIAAPVALVLVVLARGAVAAPPLLPAEDENVPGGFSTETADPGTPAKDENVPGGFVTETDPESPAVSPTVDEVPRADAPVAAEEIVDPEDDDGSDAVGAPKDGGSVASAVVGGETPAHEGPRLLSWWARGTLRLGLDTHHSGPRSEALPGVREDVMALLSDAAVGLRLRPRSALRLQASGRLRLLVSARRPTEQGETYALFNGDLHRTDFEALVGETFVELSTRHLDLLAGTVSTVWGASDLVNPNDRLTARDLRLGLTADHETTSLPVLSARAGLHLGPVTCAVVWQPVFVPHRVDLFGSDFAVLGPGAPPALRLVGDLADRLADDTVESSWQGPLVQSSAPRPFAQSSVGVRLSGSVRGWDLALQYVYGHERLPVVRLHRDVVAHLVPYLLDPPAHATTDVLRSLARSFGNAPIVESVYLRQHQAGLSVSGVLWRIVVDADLALVSRQAEPLAGGDGHAPHGLPLERQGNVWSTSTDTPVLAYTLGGRYARGEELLLKLEWWHELLLDPLARPAASRRALLLGGPQRGGLALLARYTVPRWGLTARLLLHSDLLQRSFIAAPELAYRFGDHLTVFFGGTVHEGTGGAGALFDHNDEVHLGLRGYL